MKLKIDCDSILLQNSLEYYLKEYLDKNGVLITDNKSKNGIIIGKDIRYPFTKHSLFVDLENYFLHRKEESIEEKISNLFDEFKDKLITILKEHYGKE